MEVTVLQQDSFYNWAPPAFQQYGVTAHRTLMGLQVPLAGPMALLSEAMAVLLPVAQGDGKVNALAWKLCKSFFCVTSL